MRQTCAHSKECSNSGGYRAAAGGYAPRRQQQRQLAQAAAALTGLAGYANSLLVVAGVMPLLAACLTNGPDEVAATAAQLLAELLRGCKFSVEYVADISSVSAAAGAVLPLVRAVQAAKGRSASGLGGDCW